MATPDKRRPRHALGSGWSPEGARRALTAMTYIDSSSLLKTLWNEPESAAVRTAIAAEHRVVVSALTELEVEVQLRARLLAGSTAPPQYRAYRKRLASFREVEPFEFADVSGTVFRAAIDQQVSSREDRKSTRL